MDLTLLFIIAVAILGIINGIVQVIKKAFKVAARYIPVVSVSVGILTGVLIQPLTDYNLYTMAIGGLIGGLAACGTFDLSKVATKKED